jgi:hypothetical protein
MGRDWLAEVGDDAVAELCSTAVERESLAESPL